MSYLEKKELLVLIYYLFESQENFFLKQINQPNLNQILAIYYDQILKHEHSDPHLIQICLSFFNMCCQELQIDLSAFNDVETVLGQIEMKYASVENNSLAKMAG